MNDHQHTVLLLLVLIVGLRLLHSGRLSNAWGTLWAGVSSAKPAKPTPALLPSTGGNPPHAPA